MKPNNEMVFTVGRTQLMNGPTGTPFPGSIRQVGADRIQLEGVYHPEAVANDSIEQRHARSLAFVQQWTGLANESDAVPLVCERQPQLTGMYRVRSAAIDWIKSLTVNGGTVAYSAELERIRPGSSSAVLEVQYAATPRSVAEHAVTPEGLIFVPSDALHQNALLLQVNRQGETGSVAGDRLPGSGAVAVVDSLQYGIRPAAFYSAACTVEMRHHRPAAGAAGVAASFGDWVPAVGTQIPAVEARDVRITNGVVRCTWLGQDIAENTAEDGKIVVETWTGSAWSEVARFQIIVAFGAPIRPIGTPTVVINTPESVTLKVACDTSSNTRSQYVSYSIDRGQRFVRMSASAGEITMKEVDTATAAETAITGGIKSNATNADGWGWVFACAGAIVADVGDGVRWSIGDPLTTTQQEWAFAAWESDVFETAEEIVQQWWLAQSASQRFVAL